MKTDRLSSDEFANLDYALKLNASSLYLEVISAFYSTNYRNIDPKYKCLI